MMTLLVGKFICLRMHLCRIKNHVKSRILPQMYNGWTHKQILANVYSKLDRFSNVINYKRYIYFHLRCVSKLVYSFI